MKSRPSNANDPEKVPLFSSWRNAYATVVIAFIVEVALFYAMTRLFA
jgi:hypothetical protein